MPDPLTLKIMDNIVQKCGQYEPEKLKHKDAIPRRDAHLSDSQVKSLEDIIHKRSSVKAQVSTSKKNVGKMSLDDFVNHSKTP